jgi:hypothetical protein
MELTSKIWMNGNLEWFTYINDDDMYLGKREVPVPLEEGDPGPTTWRHVQGH